MRFVTLDFASARVPAQHDAAGVEKKNGVISHRIDHQPVVGIGQSIDAQWSQRAGRTVGGGNRCH
jgi:hypothetical protein